MRSVSERSGACSRWCSVGDFPLPGEVQTFSRPGSTGLLVPRHYPAHVEAAPHESSQWRQPPSHAVGRSGTGQWLTAFQGQRTEKSTEPGSTDVGSASMSPRLGYMRGATG